MTPLAVSLSCLMGLLVGSFLNVVIHRVPRDLSVVRPRSACPDCGVSISWYRNVPVLSWLMLRGKCSSCGGKISPRYLLVEIGTALIFSLVTYLYFQSKPIESFDIAGLLELLALLVFFSCTICLSFIDLEHFRLPTKIVLFSSGFLILLLVVISVFRQDWTSAIGAAVGSLGLFALFGVIHLISPQGMGRGDVNLAALLGLMLGWFGLGPVLVGTFLGFALGALFGVGLILLGRGTGKTRIPFGPWMVVGSWLGLLFGEQLWLQYLTLNGILD